MAAARDHDDASSLQSHFRRLAVSAHKSASSSRLEVHDPSYPERVVSRTDTVLPFQTGSTSIEAASHLHQRSASPFRSIGALIQKAKELSTMHSYLDQQDFTHAMQTPLETITMRHTTLPIDKLGLEKPATMTLPNNFVKVLNQLRSLEVQHSTSISLVTALRMELEHAHHRVQELEFVQKSVRTEINHLVRNMAEEKITVHTKEQQSAEVVIQCLKNEIEEVKKARKKLEMLNKKLVRDILESKKALARASEKVDRERKTCKLMEGVCYELIKELGQEKTEIQQLKRQHNEAREQVDEEKKMLQMARAWKEKKVKMRLEETGVDHQEKNKDLCKLVSKVEAFLNTHGVSDGKVDCHREEEIREAEMLLEAVSSLKLHYSQDKSSGNGHPVELNDFFESRLCHNYFCNSKPNRNGCISERLESGYTSDEGRTCEPDSHGESQLDEGNSGKDDGYNMESDTEADSRSESGCRSDSENDCAWDDGDGIQEGITWDSVMEVENDEAACMSSDTSEGCHGQMKYKYMGSRQCTWAINSDTDESSMS